MKKLTWLTPLLLVPGLAVAGVQFAVGPGGGLGLPVGGNIRHYQPGVTPGFDARLSGFQPVLGLSLAAGYSRFKGPGSSNPAADSSAFAHRYFPVALCLVTDFSQVLPRPVVNPYLRLGLGPCYWDLRYADQLLPTLDTSLSRQVDYVLTAAVGAERKLGRLPLAVFAEVTADYITSTHFEKYYYLDKDEYYLVLSAGLRYLLP